MRMASYSGIMEIVKVEERRENAHPDYVQHQPGKGDRLIKEGRLGETMGPILEELQPEAAYFTDVEGTRGGLLVVDIEDGSQIPTMVEPLLLALGATVRMQPVMTPEDLRGAAGEALQQMGQKYG
jgi:hypothetical protein